MIRWINEFLGTAPGMIQSEDSGIAVLDVRDLVDKTGNTTELVKEKIERGLSLLRQGKKVVVCCDYGISRSNAIAAGILAAHEDMQLSTAVRTIIERTGERAIKVELVSAIRHALEGAAEKRKGGQTHKHVLVTGGAGFIGKAVLEQLNQQSDMAVYSPGREELDLYGGSIELDLFVREHGVNCILHLANPRVYTDNRAMGETLVMLRNVLDVCRENEIRLIYPSCWEVYSGYCAHSLLASEILPALPRGPYGETKHLCEVLVRHHAAMYGLNCLILRSSPVYGPGAERPKFIYTFIQKALRGDEIVTHKYLNGPPSLDLLYVDDFAAVTVAAIVSGIAGEVNIGSGRAVTTKEVAEMVIKATGSSSKISQISVNACVANITMNIQKTMDTLGWTPKTAFEIGLEKLLHALKPRAGTRAC